MADFDRITDENGVTKYVKDSDARTQIIYARKDLEHMVIIVDYTNYGGKTYIDGVGWRDVVELNHFGEHGLFSPEYNCSCLRLIFVHSEFYDGNLPLMFYFFDPTDRLYKTTPVYRDIDRTVPMKYQEGDILDFVYDDTNHCFYLVDADQSSGTIEAEDVDYDNTVSGLTATDVQDAIDELADEKVDKVSGKGLSEEDFTTTLKTKLDSINAGAEVNVQSNWTEADTTSDAYIQNKPSLATVATSGDYGDLINKPTIPAAQVNSDWDAASGVAQILNKPSLATVASSGSYNDLSNKPTIPAAQVNSDWNASSGVTEILNKPSLATVATSGEADDVSYVNTTSGLSATDVQGAIDELNSDKMPNYTIGANLQVSSNELQSLNRPIQCNGTQFRGALTHTPLNFIDGSGTTASNPNAGNLKIDLNIKTVNGDSLLGSGNIVTPDTKPSDWMANEWTDNVPNLTAGYGHSCTLSKGIWLVYLYAYFPSNANGYRYYGLTKAGDNTGYTYRYCTSQPAINGSQTCVTAMVIVNVTSATEAWLTRMYHNAGSQLNSVINGYKAIKLM